MTLNEFENQCEQLDQLLVKVDEFAEQKNLPMDTAEQICNAIDLYTASKIEPTLSK